MASTQSEAETSLVKFRTENKNVISYAVISQEGIVVKCWYRDDASKDHQYFVTQSSAVLQISALVGKTTRSWGSGTGDDGGNTTIRIRTSKLSEFIILTYGDYFLMVEQDCSFKAEEGEVGEANQGESADAS